MKPRTLLELGRVSNLPTVWSNVLAGAVLSGHAVASLPVLIAALAGSAFYVGGMFLNDAFDAEIDARERRERPIPSGRASRVSVFALGFALLGSGLLVLGAGALSAVLASGKVVIAGAFTAICVVFYDLWHKGRPLSPVVMGLCRASLYLIGAFAFTQHLEPTVVLGGAALALYVVGLTHIARFETRARIARIWPIAFVTAPLLHAALRLAPALGLAVIPSIVLWATATGWVIRGVRLAVRGGRDIGRAVVSLIAGISLIDAVHIAVTGNHVLAVAAVFAFALTLTGQRYIRGT